MFRDVIDRCRHEGFDDDESSRREAAGGGFQTVHDRLGRVEVEDRVERAERE